MNAEQKQRAQEARQEWVDYEWSGADSGSEFEVVEIANKMAALLQELIEAPEPEPVAHAVILPHGMTRIWFSDKESGEQWLKQEGIKQKLTPLYPAPPVNNQSEQHLEMVNLPALSDERILHHLDAILKASGSGLKNYSMHKPIEEMKQAIRAIEREILGGSEK